MRAEANYKHFKLSSSKPKMEGNEYVIKIENTMTGNFEHIPFHSKVPINGKHKLLRAFRDILVAAQFGQMNPPSFCAKMNLDPNTEQAQTLFQKSRRTCEQLDSVLSLDYISRYWDTAKDMVREGLVPPLDSAIKP